MKRKSTVSHDTAVKRRKQDGVSDEYNEDTDNPDVQSMQAELSTLKTKEIQDAMKLASSVPHMILKPLKPSKVKKAKPPSTVGSSLSTAGNSSSISTKPPSTTSRSTPAPIANTSVRSKPSSSTSANTLSIPKRTNAAQIPDSGSLITQKQKSVAKSKEQARRSSFAQRGKRVSGSFESGEAVIPHDSVPSEKLYRHIDSDLPEPHRARHLLVWCARRAASDMSSGQKTSKKSKLDSQDTALLATVQDRVVRQLMELKIDIPLYDLGFGLGSKKEKGEKPLEEDPANIKNREHKERLTKAEERARDEDAMWSKVIQDYNTLQSTVLSTLSAESSSKSRPFDVRLSELDDKWQKVDEELEFYRMECEKGSELDSKLAARCRMLPVKLDALRQSLSRSNAFTEQAKEFIDTLFASIDQSSLGNTTNPFSSTANKTSNLLMVLASSTTDPDTTKAKGAELFKALAKSDPNTKNYDAAAASAPRRLTTVIQPSTPRRMPGTPRKVGGAGGDNRSTAKKP
ncbi:hypothetical protein CPB86DRAFT_790176 [Serendipita vermifera]|nr:hypothetical protein CPB86DRAFT_790176 [Serendipita vermifera]